MRGHARPSDFGFLETLTVRAYDIAEKLYREAESEHCYRAAASRAYISVFQHLLAHPTMDGFHRVKTGEIHQRLIEYLKAASTKPHKTIGTRMLHRLRALRNSADYDLQERFTKDKAQEALDYASEIIDDLLPQP
jgi:uncharacterized protein (UPF0332 family)